MYKKFNQLLHTITVVDRIFIGIALLTVILFYLVFKRDVVTITIRTKITEDNLIYALTSPTDEFSLGFIKGDTERDSLGRVVSEIVGVESYKYKADQRVVYVDIRLKSVYNPRKNIYSIRGKDILFGESILFSFSKVHFKGMVVDFPGFRETIHITSNKTIVKAQLRDESRTFSDVYGVPDYLAYALKKGDIISDAQGNPLVKILSVTINPAKRIITNQYGQTFVIDDPVLKDVFYTLEVTTKVVNGITYMFDFKPLVIGEEIPLISNTVNLWPMVTEIER